MEQASLAISVVSYSPDLALLGTTLESVAAAVDFAKARGAVGEARCYVVDNGPGSDWSARLESALAPLRAGEALDGVELLTGHGNVGFGAGNNLALKRSDAEFVLVLNPDVVLEPNAIEQALSYLSEHNEAVLVTPRAFWPDGSSQYLCKRYPSVFDLFLRGFVPGIVRWPFRRRLARYEMRDRDLSVAMEDVPIASGCFMLVRSVAWQRVGGFDPDYFLYFEDFDLSLRIRSVGKIAYVPSVRIVHHGGGAARKSWRHIRLFIRSAWLFFNRHGWRWC